MTGGTDIFGRRSVRELVLDVMERLGQTAPIAAIVAGFRGTATKDEWEWHADKAMAGAIRAALTQDTERGLPAYLSVGGAYKALTLFEPADYEEKAHDYAQRSKANKDMVYVLRDACLDAHGVAFDADAVCEKYGLAA
jgi:hypothetical protein